MIYPCFGSVFECNKSYKSFEYRKKYKITGFGNHKLKVNNKKVDVWQVISLGDNGIKFMVLKSTIKELFNKGILIDE